MMKNIVFDLGGVVFWRNPKKCTQEFLDFFAFVRETPMPHFWNEYDRGALSLDEVMEHLMMRSGFSREKCVDFVQRAIDMQEAIRPTEALIEALKADGRYRLFVLSNMSREFIDFLRRVPVYRHFDGEVVSCEEGICKPEPEIYRLLLERYALDPAETSLGVRVAIEHRAPSVLGATVTVTATVQDRDGRRVSFAVRAVDAGTVVAEGIVERVIVDRERFLARL